MCKAFLFLFVTIVDAARPHIAINLPDAPDNDVVLYSGYLDLEDDSHAHYM